jgi:outer membrane protein assembly factor BamA
MDALVQACIDEGYAVPISFEDRTAGESQTSSEEVEIKKGQSPSLSTGSITGNTKTRDKVIAGGFRWWRGSLQQSKLRTATRPYSCVISRSRLSERKRAQCKLRT